MLMTRSQSSSVFFAQDQEPLIQEILRDIADALWNHRLELAPNLASGLAGAALFLGYLSRRPGFEGMKERAHELLSLAVDRVEQASDHDLYGGFPGLAWCIEHLSGRILEADEEDPNTDVDEVLLELLQREAWVEDYDLISGLVGLGVYALERLPRPSAHALLQRILDHLDSLAMPMGQGLAWPTPPDLMPAWQRERCPQGYLNLGLAHGNPGVLVLLAAIQRAGVDPKRSTRLLEGGMAWLKTQVQTPLSEDGGYLAGWCPMDEARLSPEPGRVAWCYGDLGASLALLNVARLTQEPAWETLALDLARHAAARPIESSGVRDICLCHGSAGNLQMFHRLFKATGEYVFLEAARVYLKHVLETRVPGQGFAGFLTYHPITGEAGETHSDQSPYTPDPGLLEGAAGVGLALLSCLDGEGLEWDRFMFLSTPLLSSALR